MKDIGLTRSAARRRKALGEAVRHHRGQMTQVELAERLGGMTQAAVSHWERGQRDVSYEQVRAIELALGLHLGTIGRTAGFLDDDVEDEQTIVTLTLTSAGEAARAVEAAAQLGLGVRLHSRASTEDVTAVQAWVVHVFMLDVS